VLEICILHDQLVIKNRSDDVIILQGPLSLTPCFGGQAVNGLTLSYFMDVVFYAPVNCFHMLLCRNTEDAELFMIIRRGNFAFARTLFDVC